MIRATGIKRPLDRLRITVSIRHVIREDHKLSQINEASKLRIAKALINTITLINDAISIIRFFNLNKDQRHTIDQQDDIRTEFFIPVFISQLGDDMKAVVIEVFKIDQFDA